MAGSSFDHRSSISLFGGFARTYFLPRLTRINALTEVTIPFWVVSGTAGLVLLFAISPWLTIPEGHCQSCGYNMRQLTSTVCPECGEPIASRTAQTATQPSETDSSRST
ncbi:MAG: hypothetical protein KF805_07165 [Phycisphaeraceae bacterium]|nr:hypothetical protein [Phycisphaeraceae bacterium]